MDSRRIAVVAAVAALLAAGASGADTRLGVHGGWSRATVSVVDLEAGLESEARDGYDAGLRLELGLGSRLSLLALPSLVERGGAIRETGTEERLRLDTRYFELPVLLKLAAGEGVRPYLLAGASFAWRNRARLSLEVAGEELASEDASDSVAKTDVLLQAGGGLEVEAGTRVRVFAEGLYAWGLRGLDAGDPGSFDFVDAKNRGFALRAGFVVRLGR